MGLVADNRWAERETSSMEPKQQNGYSSVESPLAAQLQQVWLQTQMPRRSVPKLDFTSPPVEQVKYFARSSSSSSSSSQPSTPSVSPDTRSGRAQSVLTTRGGERDLEVDPPDVSYMLQFLSELLMEEETTEKHHKCMYVQCSAYQAMNRELADLINDPSPAAAIEGMGDTAMPTWMDELGYSNSGGSYGDEQSGLTEHSYGRLGSESPGVSVEQSIPLFRNLDLDCVYLESDSTFASGIDYASGRSGIESLGELFPLLTQCAQAVASDDVRGAQQLITQLRHKSSPLGDGGQRLTYYLVEALVARLSGTGARLYSALTSNRPSATEMIQATRSYVQCNPLLKVSHYFANSLIFEALGNADRVHIIDYGILLGVQWPCLLKSLSSRAGGPPHVRITGIEFPQSGLNNKERLQETGKRLVAKAKRLGVELEFHAIAGKWESIQSSQLNLKSDEVLIVNCMFRLRNLLDESVMASSPRQTVLSRIHSLNPRLFVMGVINAGYNAPFFMSRFRETVDHFSAKFDALHSSSPPNADFRRVIEKECFGREILNVIACEGTERIERAETLRQWQSRSLKAGFVQEPLIPQIVKKAKTLVAPFHRHYGVGEDGNWLVTGWRDRVLNGVTSWRSA